MGLFTMATRLIVAVTVVVTNCAGVVVPKFTPSTVGAVSLLRRRTLMSVLPRLRAKRLRKGSWTPGGSVLVDVRTQSAGRTAKESVVYSFTTSFVAATYGSTSALVVAVARTSAGNAITGAMTTGTVSTADWTNGTIATARVVTYGTQIAQTVLAVTAAYTCSSNAVAIAASASVVASRRT